MEKVLLTVNGMTCTGCVGSVKNLLGRLPGVSDIEITLENGQVAFAYDPLQSKLESIKEAIHDGGYEVA
ncbi:MAG: heavy metal-associated domain-containing protein [Sulfuricellaceae bacterium]|nr:heavy metal-associated domain-containing protein [Sulfuricellaceae bacterium]